MAGIELFLSHPTLPLGQTPKVEIADDITVKDLITELITIFSFPTLDTDGSPLIYWLQSKSQNRFLSEAETLKSAGIQMGDTLVMFFTSKGGRQFAKNETRALDFALD